ncbi:MAG: hypothetical protein HFG20_01770 [Anaerotruncus sp.]|nr:hypothetical protein [Anaerotruncus sp.]
MGNAIKRTLDTLQDHYNVLCLLLALFTLGIIGVGNALVVGVLGLVLCIQGLLLPSFRADGWFLLPLVFYNLFSMASSYVTFGNFIEGYASTQLIFPVLYLLLVALDGEELQFLRRSCVLLAGVVAAAGIGKFLLHAMRLNTGRLGGIIGGPNALGIFLVVSWFALRGCALDEAEHARIYTRLLRLEPLLLAALALTLSMGSFVAMAIGILALLLLQKWDSWKSVFRYTCRVIAKAVLGVGTGLLLYLAADRAEQRWLCVLITVYLVALMLGWEKLGLFLAAYPRMAAAISFSGVLVAGVAVLVRPSSIATFAERLAMMRNGLGYLGQNPLLGVGPYQWRRLNLYDADTYFNTYHIHNVLLHVGVELGLAAMLMLLVVIVRYYYKKTATPIQKAGFTAFVFHNLIDTGFFYLGLVAMAILTVGNPSKNCKSSNLLAKTLFAGMAVVFSYNIYYCLTNF